MDNDTKCSDCRLPLGTPRSVVDQRPTVASPLMAGINAELADEVRGERESLWQLPP